jgi:hypothetical protein
MSDGAWPVHSGDIDNHKELPTPYYVTRRSLSLISQHHACAGEVKTRYGYQYKRCGCSRFVYVRLSEARALHRGSVSPNRRKPKVRKHGPLNLSVVYFARLMGKAGVA